MRDFFRTLSIILVTTIATAAIILLWIYAGNKENKLAEYFSNNVAENVIGETVGSEILTQKLQVIKKKIDESYLYSNEIDENQINEYIIKGYVAGLGDPYSTYYTEAEMKEMMSETTATYVGIGVSMVVNKETNLIEVYSVMENSPAQEAGIQIGDFIIGVDGKEYTADDFDTIADEIQGLEGTKVKITIKRNEEIKEYEITRKKLDITHVSGQMLDNEIGYIRIDSFDGKIAQQFESIYNELVEKGMKKLIVDTRNNGGGLVNQATELADYFLERDTKILTEKTVTDSEIVTYAKTDKIVTMPTVVLVNKYSASATEIFAAALKEKASNVTIVGQTTYGKGVIQGLYQLTDGSGLKLTIEEYFTPDGNSINEVGVKPDEVVEGYQYLGKLDEEKDTQLQKAKEILNK